MESTETQPTELYDLSSYRIADLPPNFYYIPSFLSAEESTSLLSKIPSNRWTRLRHRRLQAHPTPLTKTNVLLSSKLPKWLVDPIFSRFEQLGVFNHTLHKKPNHCLVNEYDPGEGIMPHEDGPAYANVVATVSLGGTVVLELYDKQNTEEQKPAIREVTDHQGADVETQALQSLTQEEDERGPIAAGTDTAGRPKPLYRILQEPGSLLITTGQAYTSVLHSISPIRVDTDLSPDTVANWHLLGDSESFKDGTRARTTRISLTYRDVLKTSNAGSRILGR